MAIETRPDRTLHLVKTASGYGIAEPRPQNYSNSPITSTVVFELTEGELAVLAPEAMALIAAKDHPDVVAAVAVAEAARAVQVQAEKAAVDARAKTVVADAAVTAAAEAVKIVVPVVPVVPVPAPPAPYPFVSTAMSDPFPAPSRPYVSPADRPVGSYVVPPTPRETF